MKVQKGNVVKHIDSEALLADYITAGWKKVEDKKPSKYDRLERVKDND